MAGLKNSGNYLRREVHIDSEVNEMISEERILKMVEEKNIIVPVPMPLLPWPCVCLKGCGAEYEAPAELGVDSVKCPECGLVKDMRLLNTTGALFGYWKGLNGMGYY